MDFDSDYFGPQGYSPRDAEYRGSHYSQIKKDIFRDRYYITWGLPDNPPLPTFGVTLARGLKRLLQVARDRWSFQEAAKRAVDSHADMRWGGPSRKGFRRLIHPNAVVLFGEWEIYGPGHPKFTGNTGYTGYFKEGSRGLTIGRYSTCCSETRRGRNRSLSMVGKIFPTLDENHPELLRPANFITQEDIGGSNTLYFNDVEIRNAPDVTPARRGGGFAFFLLTALVLLRSDTQITIRQLYEIAELGKLPGEKTRSPLTMRLLVDPGQRRIEGKDLDFREELLWQIYDKGDPAPKRPLIFNIEVSDDQGTTAGILSKRRIIKNWKPIGRIVFKEAAASYTGDFVLNFHHPAWRNDVNDPKSLARKPRH